MYHELEKAASDLEHAASHRHAIEARGEQDRRAATFTAIVVLRHVARHLQPTGDPLEDSQPAPASAALLMAIEGAVDDLELVQPFWSATESDPQRRYREAMRRALTLLRSALHHLRGEPESAALRRAIG